MVAYLKSDLVLVKKRLKTLRNYDLSTLENQYIVENAKILHKLYGILRESTRAKIQQQKSKESQVLPESEKPAAQNGSCSDLFADADNIETESLVGHRNDRKKRTAKVTSSKIEDSPLITVENNNLSSINVVKKKEYSESLNKTYVVKRTTDSGEKQSEVSLSECEMDIDYSLCAKQNIEEEYSEDEMSSETAAVQESCLDISVDWIRRPVENTPELLEKMKQILLEGRAQAYGLNSTEPKKSADKLEIQPQNKQLAVATTSRAETESEYHLSEDHLKRLSQRFDIDENEFKNAIKQCSK